MGNKDKVLVSQLLSLAGVRIGGERPWDIQVHDERFYPRLLAGGTRAMGESYMDGWWDCAALDQMVARVLQAELDKTVSGVGSELRLALRAVVLNLQGKRRAYEVGETHYDTGNDLFKSMLDKRMNYSCGSWRNARTLDEAQESKLELCCRKLDLRPGMSVLDIGCGWGGFAGYAAETHGVKVTGITISKEQAVFAREACEGLPVTIAFQDYRTLGGKFDRAVSIGMIEHVGYKNYRTFMETVHDVLNDGGIFLLQTIGSNTSGRNGEPWMDKYIFPNGMLPSPKHLAKASEGLFVIEDWHNFGADYDKTLMAWHGNFVRNWPGISRDGPYDQRFFRMWTYYLLSCAGGFRARKNQLWQVVFAKSGVPGGYLSPR